MERAIRQGRDASNPQPGKTWGLVTANELESGPFPDLPCCYLDYSLVKKKKPESEPPTYTVPGFLCHRNGEIINIDNFKPLSFGVICYPAIDNGYTNGICSISIKKKKKDKPPIKKKVKCSTWKYMPLFFS